MRIICTISPEESGENPKEFSAYLTTQGIQNEPEEMPTGTTTPPVYRIWVYDEDLVDQAKDYYQTYRKNPQDARYKGLPEQVVKAKQEQLFTENAEETDPQPRRRRILSPAPYGPISIFILITVISLFVWSQIQRGTVLPPKIPGLIQAPLLAPIEKALIYDYPQYFELRDHFFTVYTPKDIEEKKPPSSEARMLLQELKNTPVWMGFYDRFVMHMRNKDIPLAYTGPIFEKIGQGEVWRVFTPALLHFDLLHIFFNILWFILLGNQIEYRIGGFRYLTLIIISAILSNTAQYLMSGPFFMGLSGVVVAMAGFIWARQQVAPWEGYLLHRFTLIFLAIFVVGMFILQLVFFVLQLAGKFELTIGIANTAHLTGAVVGYLLGRLPFFATRSHK